MSEDSLRALVVDDDREMRESLQELLLQAGWQVDICARGRDGLNQMANRMPDVILCDIRMPGISGLALLAEVIKMQGPPVVLISAHADIDMAVQAMRDGAYTFLEKPFDPHRLLTALRHGAEQSRLKQSTQRLRARLARLSGLDRILLGQSPAIVRLREDILDLADLDTTVLLQGETGTGKELVARALHDLSPRSDRSFVALSCATLPAAHFETSLFGDDTRDGLLAKADGGTLFLDEIAACPLDVQAKLLRVLETGEYFPVNTTTPRQTNIHWIAASNEHLQDAVAEKRFREDLLFRLNVMVLSIPPLRQRPDDIVLLFTHFLGLAAALYETDIPANTAEDLASLHSHDWPGNIRELRNVADRRILSARRGAGSVAQALSPLLQAEEAPIGLRGAVAAFERQMIANALKTHAGRMEDVADALGIGRRTLNEKIVKLGLDKEALL